MRVGPPGGGATDSVSGVVGVLDGLVDAAAVGDLVAVILRPGPDLPGVRVTTRGAGPGAAGTTTGGLAASRRERAQCLPQLLGVGGGEVDLVVLAVEAELDGVFGGAAVEVVLEVHFDFLSHGWCSFRYPVGGVGQG